MTRALVRRPGPRLDEGIVTHIARSAVDLTLAQRQWSEYVETFNNLLAEDAALHAEIFGEEFASAYASVALGDETAASDDGE